MHDTQQGQVSSSLLVIEDNASQLKSLLDILETEGLQPIGCQSGREALAACQEHNVHVVILDLRLPDMDGLDVLTQLKQQTPDMKVIINTAYATLESAMQAVNKEAYAYVQKMGDTEELLAHVHRAFHVHLAGYSEQLEGEVRKSTAELVAANDALRQEIAEHKQTEKALRESEENFRALAENANDGILIATGEGVHIYANKRAAEITGYSVAELRTGTIKDVLHPDEFKMVMERYTKRLKGEPIPNQYETVFVRKDGQNIPIEISAAKTIWQGQPASLIIIRDITERKQAEKALQAAHNELEHRVEERTAELRVANAELARTSRLKDEFLANMSHELRTPLTVILGMSESLREEIYGPLNERQLRSLRMIEDSGHHLLTLITDILDLSKIGAGKLGLVVAPVSVESICRASLQFIKQSAQKKQLTVSSIFNNAVTHIQADGRRLKQVFVNLLSNAVKFTPKGGEIGLEVESDPERGAVNVTVWDTGIGIAQEDMEHLFQPFMQLDASLSRKYNGAGLGLSLVYRMVEMHGGSVSVESEVGTGSRFTVSLPWQESGEREIGSLGEGESKEHASHPPISLPPHLPPSLSPQSTTILIAEDNDATITTLSGYLSAKGYHVLLARDGWEAFTHTREHQPDLIVMDIQMPDMDGLEAIRHIRSDPHSTSIPIIALTALAMPGDREKCLAAGADEYLSKPVSLRKLSDILEGLLAKPEHAQEQ